MLLSPTVRQFEGEAHTNHLYNEHYILETLQIFRSKTFQFLRQLRECSHNFVSSAQTREKKTIHENARTKLRFAERF